jgi:type III restriction enzyme
MNLVNRPNGSSKAVAAPNSSRPIPQPRKRKSAVEQQQIVFDEGMGLSTEKQQYDPTSAAINELSHHVDQWRRWQNPNDWKVTPNTQRLLQHWRQHRFTDVRPFFCQIEAVETAIWLIEAPRYRRCAGSFDGSEHAADPIRRHDPR